MAMQGQPIAEAVNKPLNVPHCNINGRTNEIEIGDSCDNYQKIVKLIGEKCLISCFLQGTKTQALLDTGAQVSIILTSLLNDNFPEIEISNVSKLLGSETALDLKTATGSTLPYNGYVVLSFSLQEGTGNDLKVPMLVTDANIDNAIIGYNVLEEIISNSSHNSVDFLRWFPSKKSLFCFNFWYFGFCF